MKDLREPPDPAHPDSPASAPATSELVRRLAQATRKESRYALEGEIARGGTP